MRTMYGFKPLRSCSIYDLTKVKLPVFASFKHDGIRCEYIISPRSGNPLAASRKLLPIPNNYIRRTIKESKLPIWISGELTAGNNYSECESAIMSAEGEPAFQYRLFDYFGASMETLTRMNGFARRLDMLHQRLIDCKPGWCSIIEHTLIETLEQLIAFEQQAFDLGFEGIVLRKPTGRYKCGRSTPLDGLSHRYVRMERVDCEVIGFNQKLTNENPLEMDYLGYAKRSKSMANMIPANKCGSVIVKALHDTSKTKAGVVFNLTIGEFKLQREIWQNRKSWMGRVLVAEFKPYGTKDAPRQPVFLRERLDHEI